MTEPWTVWTREKYISERSEVQVVVDKVRLTLTGLPLLEPEEDANMSGWLTGVGPYR